MKKSWAIEGLSDLHRQGFMKFRAPKKAKVPGPRVACTLCADWHEAGKHRRWVWTVGANDEPLTALRAFADTKAASEWAQSEARGDRVHDRVVTIGYSPTEPGFRVLVRYQAGSGERVV